MIKDESELDSRFLKKPNARTRDVYQAFDRQGATADARKDSPPAKSKFAKIKA